MSRDDSPREADLFKGAQPARRVAWNLVSTRASQYHYFDRQLKHPAWRESRILDLGGNVGTFLMSARGVVDPVNYWCVDLNREVVELGRRTHPGAHFIHYDRYSSQYNPGGVRYLPLPAFDFQFDIILAFSVFTHVHRDEMLELVEQMRARLRPGGVIGFTFCDARYNRSLTSPLHDCDTFDIIKRQRRAKGLPADGVDQAREADWFLLIDDDVYVQPGPKLNHQERRGRPLESYCSFFTVNHMKTLYPDAEVLPPIRPEWQHCCVLRS